MFKFRYSLALAPSSERIQIHSLRRRTNARNVSFRISLRWPIHIINSVDKTKLSCFESSLLVSSTMMSVMGSKQEPITRSVQLPHIPVTAFLQTDLFLVWIYREFRPPQEP